MTNTLHSIEKSTHSESLAQVTKAEQANRIKLLTFYLANEEYGIDINKVIEIIGELPIVSIPKLPEYIKGVINLRGRIIPVMDLRLRLGMATKEKTSETVIVIVQSQKQWMGLVIDKVTEVLDIMHEDIEDVPEFGTSIENKYIMGIGKKNDTIKILLDIDKVLVSEELEALPQEAKNSIHELN